MLNDYLSMNQFQNYYYEGPRRRSWGRVRESGTEPVIRVMVEAASKELCEKYVDDVIQVIVDKGHAAVM